MKEAIEIYSKLGDWEKYCELSVELGEWEKALIAAPNIGINYWRELMRRYLDHCDKNDKHEKSNIARICKDSKSVFNNCVEKGTYEDSKLQWIIQLGTPCMFCLCSIRRKSKRINN